MLVKDIMLKNPKTVFIGQTLSDVCRTYRAQGVNCAPVVDSEGAVVGILTVFQVLEALEAGRAFSTRVEEVMERNITTFGEETHFNQVCSLPVDRLVILNQQNRLAGVLTRIDLINKVHRVLEQTEYALLAMLQSIKNGIVGVTAEGTICYFNAAAERLLGIENAQALGCPVEPLLASIGVERIDPAVDAVLGRFTAGKNVFILLQCPIKNDATTPGGYVLVLHDISELEKMANELDSVRMLNKELGSVIQSCYDGIVVLNNKGNITRINESCGRILGLVDPSSLMGKNVAELIEGEGRHLHYIFRDIVEGKSVSNLAVQTVAGKEIVLSGSPVMDGKNRIVQIVVNLRDITELNMFKNEAAKAAVELGELRKWQLEHDDIVAKSPSMLRAVEQALRVAKTDSKVLITGPSGIGKERLANFIHSRSTRADKPLICINCGAIPENLIESELFGYERGAFTGAQRDGKPGLLEIANDGTVFLDEIGDMPLNMQVKLLRVLQENVIYRVGGSKAIKLNIRVMAATNRDLKEMVKAKLFREDLYYRLSVVPIDIAPLRERREDILQLAIFALNKFNAQHQTNKRISPETYRLLEDYRWPGNVRELINLIERLVIMCDEDIIAPRHLPSELLRNDTEQEEWRPQMSDIVPLNQAVESVERELIQMALAKGFSLRNSAKLLGTSHPTLLRKMQQYNLRVQK